MSLQILKPVITFDTPRLQTAMEDLWDTVVASGFAPDAVVAVASGGVRCAELIAPQIGVPVHRCTLRRAGTAQKERMGAQKLLSRMPYMLTDAMRRVEDATTAARSRAEPHVRGPTEALRTDVRTIAEVARRSGYARILVIDDAIDSGATLAQVMTALHEALPVRTVFRTAVITQTRANALIDADYALYQRTLCRFPWSFDFRGGATS